MQRPITEDEAAKAVLYYAADGAASPTGSTLTGEAALFRLRTSLDVTAAALPEDPRRGVSVALTEHPSVPGQAEAISMATHKANVYIDLSGWRPSTSPLSRCA